jgi:hypothetical protein
MNRPKPYDDFTLVIQGPLHAHSVKGILGNYATYTNHIVVSHWHTDDDSLRQQIADVPNIKIITNQFVPCTTEYNQQNVYYQVHTTLCGVVHAETPYTIKIRSDQWYGNLEPLFEAARLHPTKYVCANLHFRPDSVLKYHPSDKLIGMRTDAMYQTFEEAQYRLGSDALILLAGIYSKPYEQYLVSGTPAITRYPAIAPLGGTQLIGHGYHGLVPEMIIGTSYLIAKGINPTPEDSIRLVKENFHIVKVEDMVPYLNRDGLPAIEHNWIEIHDIESYG